MILMDYQEYIPGAITRDASMPLIADEKNASDNSGKITPIVNVFRC